MRRTCVFCGKPGEWRTDVPNRFAIDEVMERTCCAACWEREASAVSRLRTNRDAYRASFQSHPASYEDDIPLGGYRSVEIADSHLDDCGCRHCLHYFAHVDSEADL